MEESLREGDMLARLSQLEESRSRRMGSDENREIRVFSGKEFKSTVSRFSGFVDSISTARLPKLNAIINSNSLFVFFKVQVRLIHGSLCDRNSFFKKMLLLYS